MTGRIELLAGEIRGRGPGDRGSLARRPSLALALGRSFSALFSLLAVLVFSAAVALGADDEKIIFPGQSAPSGQPARAAGGGIGAVTIVGAFTLAGAGAWLLWRNRGTALPGRDARQLVINETRSLGSRQFLVVASYEGKKFLLGVCPGRIDLLAPLDGPGREKSL